MKKLAVMLVLMAGTFMSGCTLTETASERHRRILPQKDIEARQFVEDWDYFWLQERNSQLTQWHPYVGY